jgi:hypothetical protein
MIAAQYGRDSPVSSTSFAAETPRINGNTSSRNTSGPPAGPLDRLGCPNPRERLRERALLPGA